MFKFVRPIVVSGLCLMMPLSSSAQEQDLLFTGRVFSQQAQDLFVPLTNNWQARISMMLPEGSKVEVGDVAVEFDGSDVARELESQIEAQRTEQAKTERDIAKLEKELIEAEFQLKQSRVALELATLKADLPDGLIGGLEFAENLLNKEKAIKSVEDAEEQLKDKQSKTIERHRQASLDQQKADNQSKLWKQMLASFSVRARQAGFIIHGNHPRTRTKFKKAIPSAPATGWHKLRILMTWLSRYGSTALIVRAFNLEQKSRSCSTHCLHSRSQGILKQFLKAVAGARSGAARCILKRWCCLIQPRCRQAYYQV